MTDDRRDDILGFIGDFIEKNGYGPSIRDIMKGCHFSSTSSVSHHLEVLKADKKIDYRPRIARSVRLT